MYNVNNLCNKTVILMQIYNVPIFTADTKTYLKYTVITLFFILHKRYIQGEFEKSLMQKKVNFLYTIITESVDDFGGIK